MQIRDAVIWRGAGYDFDALLRLRDTAGLNNGTEWEVVRPFAALGLSSLVLADVLRPVLSAFRRDDQIFERGDDLTGVAPEHTSTVIDVRSEFCVDPWGEMPPF